MEPGLHPPVQCSDGQPDPPQFLQTAQERSTATVQAPSPQAQYAVQAPSPQAHYAVQAPSPQAHHAVQGSDVQPDAERVGQARAAKNQSAQGNPPGASAAGYALPQPTVDRIVLTGQSGARIEAEGLAGALVRGGTFNLANEINTTIYNHGDSPGTRKLAKIKNKFKLTESSVEPAIRHLDVISARLTEDCYKLGQHLGLSDALLQQIRLDYQADGQHEINYRILARWKQERGPVSLRMLAKALVEIGRGDLADDLRKG